MSSVKVDRLCQRPEGRARREVPVGHSVSTTEGRERDGDTRQAETNVNGKEKKGNDEPN